MKEILVCKDNKGKCRVVQVEAIYNEEGIYWEIHRQSGILNGKMTKQPVIEILTGKAKRSLNQQCELEFKSHVKKYLDKGYKTIQSLGCEDLASFDPDIHLPAQNTNQQGVVKPQLCKVYDPNDKKNLNKIWYISRKYDGVRSILYYKDGEVRTSSRGGQDYDIAATHIRTDPSLLKIFESNPTLRLDGEIYRFSWPLNKISGLCRLETLHEDHEQLNFYCYDIVDESKTFKERFDILMQMRNEIDNDSKLKIVDHYELKDLSEIDNYHDQFVADGYEGAVIRDAESKYNPGGRSRDWQKIKKFTDGEFEILGLVEGLREEDMCFLMKTKEGYEFKAKPIGTREDKQYYREHLNEMIGKMATVKYFGMTNTDQPVPNLPVFKNLVLEKDR